MKELLIFLLCLLQARLRITKEMANVIYSKVVWLLLEEQL